MTTKKKYDIIYVDISYSLYVNDEEQTYVQKYFRKLMITAANNYPTKQKYELPILIKGLLNLSNIETNHYKLLLKTKH